MRTLPPICIYDMSTVTSHTLVSPILPANPRTEDHWTKEAGMAFAKALRAFGERDDVNEAGGDSAVVVEEKKAEADLQPGELSREPPPSPRW